MEKLELDLEADDLAALEGQASVHGRSPEQEAAAILREHLHTRPLNVEAWIARSRAIRAMTPPGVAQTDSLVLLREDRDR